MNAKHAIAYNGPIRTELTDFSDPAHAEHNRAMIANAQVSGG